jgi:hypothetical protein
LVLVIFFVLIQKESGDKNVDLYFDNKKNDENLLEKENKNNVVFCVLNNIVNKIISRNASSSFECFSQSVNQQLFCFAPTIANILAIIFVENKNMRKTLYQDLGKQEYDISDKKNDKNNFMKRKEQVDTESEVMYMCLKFFCFLLLLMSYCQSFVDITPHQFLSSNHKNCYYFPLSMYESSPYLSSHFLSFITIFFTFDAVNIYKNPSANNPSSSSSQLTSSETSELFSYLFSTNPYFISPFFSTSLFFTIINQTIFDIENRCSECMYDLSFFLIPASSILFSFLFCTFISTFFSFIVKIDSSNSIEDISQFFFIFTLTCNFNIFLVINVVHKICCYQIMRIQKLLIELQSEKVLFLQQVKLF